MAFKKRYISLFQCFFRDSLKRHCSSMISDWIWPDLPFGLRKRQPSVSHGWDECRFDPRDGGALDSSISSKNVVQWEKIRFQSFTAVICPKKMTVTLWWYHLKRCIYFKDGMNLFRNKSPKLQFPQFRLVQRQKNVGCIQVLQCQ